MTGLTETWDEADRILLLGSWCRRADRRDRWEGLEEPMPSPWDDREAFHKACEDMDRCVESLLAKLAAHLNRAHGIAWSLRAWRILIGPWLIHFTHAVYDRYVCLKKAFADHPNLRTAVLAETSYRTPDDFLDFMEKVADDTYNFQLYSQLLSAQGLRFSTVTPGFEASSDAGAQARGRKGLSLKNGLKWLLATASRRLFGTARGGVLLCDMQFSQDLVWRLVLESKFRAEPFPVAKDWSFPRSSAQMNAARRELAGLEPAGEFEKALMSLLPANFPVLYLEDFKAARAEALERHPVPRGATLVSLIGWYYNEPFKFIAAEAAQRGHRLVAAQHGGGYGVYRYHPLEEHERALADTFIAWGWGEGGHARNLPNPRLSRPRSVRGRGDKILFMTTIHPRYVARLHSSPLGGQLRDYFSDQIEFLEALPAELRRAVLYRPHPLDYGHGSKLRPLQRFPELSFDATASWQSRTSELRLAVLDHDATGLLETLAADMPTVLFWDPALWEVRPQAEPYFDALRKAGILWDGPREAAAHVRRVHGDVESWWRTPAVQEARRDFIGRFAMARRDWAARWSEALLEEASASGKPRVEVRP